MAVLAANKDRNDDGNTEHTEVCQKQRLDNESKQNKLINSGLFLHKDVNST